VRNDDVALMKALMAPILTLIIFLVVGWNVHLENERIRMDAERTLANVLVNSLAQVNCRMVTTSPSSDVFYIYGVGKALAPPTEPTERKP
jgi:hypothetical protein